MSRSKNGAGLPTKEAPSHRLRDSQAPLVAHAVIAQWLRLTLAGSLFVPYEWALRVSPRSGVSIP